MADCWSCGAERGDAALCGTCGAIQPVSERLDFFGLLGLSRGMAVDKEALDRAFRETSKKLHPDRFPRDEPQQRRLALAHTERVNQAYRTLKEPFSRAEYLLSLHGAEVAGETDRTEDVELLMSMLERQQSVESARDEDELAPLESEARARAATLLAVASDYFDRQEGSLEGVRAALGEHRYIRRLLEQIALRKEELF